MKAYIIVNQSGEMIIETIGRDEEESWHKFLFFGTKDVYMKIGYDVREVIVSLK